MTTLMKYIDVNRYDRKLLNNSQKDFLQKLVPFADLLSTQILEKARFYGIDSPFGIFPSILLGMIILRSDWGETVQTKKLNNLLFVQTDDSWKGKSDTIDGVKYRSYQSWLDFCIDYSDYITFFKSSEYKDILLISSYQEQLDKISKINTQNKQYYVNIENIIIKYGLWEFD